jgi:hypothetical protein
VNVVGLDWHDKVHFAARSSVAFNAHWAPDILDLCLWSSKETAVFPRQIQP